MFTPVWLQTVQTNVIHSFVTNFAGYLKEQLDEFVQENLPLVKVLHTPSRQGLIRATIYGAAQATGEELEWLLICLLDILWNNVASAHGIM